MFLWFKETKVLNGFHGREFLESFPFIRELLEPSHNNSFHSPPSSTNHQTSIITRVKGLRVKKVNCYIVLENKHSHL